MLSALLMFQRVARAFRYAMREEDFLYFSVSTLTTTSVSGPDLVLGDRWLKVFAVLYQLIGIGILVEILRRLGRGYVAAQAEQMKADT
jgi:hypothetical protein